MARKQIWTLTYVKQTDQSWSVKCMKRLKRGKRFETPDDDNDDPPIEIRESLWMVHFNWEDPEREKEGFQYGICQQSDDSLASSSSWAFSTCACLYLLSICLHSDFSPNEGPFCPIHYQISSSRFDPTFEHSKKWPFISIMFINFKSLYLLALVFPRLDTSKSKQSAFITNGPKPCFDRHS